MNVMARAVPRAWMRPAPRRGLIQRCGGIDCLPGTCNHTDDPADAAVHRSADAAETVSGDGVPASVLRVLSTAGTPLDASTRENMEARFGHAFGRVRVHTDDEAARSAEAIQAYAYTFGSHIVMSAGRFQPHTPSGSRLLAHELTHVVQQASASPPLLPTSISDPGDASELDAANVAQAAAIGPARAEAVTPAVRPVIQRTIGDGHDLTSPRFSHLVDLEAAYDGETVIETGATGRGVQALQQALYDLGFPLPTSGADGSFGPETKAAVVAFQAAHPPLAQDGRVGPATMSALDATFGVPVLPAAPALSAPWTPACVKSVLCGFSPHTVDVLRNRITLKSFDSIFWADEEWDGASWTPAPFPGAGFNTGTEIGILNDTCEEIAQTLYHEVLHAEQPTTQTTTLATESYAYRIGEEMSIALGLSGQPALRSTDVRGRQFADRAKVASFVSTEYPSVPPGAPGEEIIGKGGAPGTVQVQRPDGSIYTRPAAVGEKVDGPIHVVNEVTHPSAAWTCP